MINADYSTWERDFLYWPNSITCEYLKKILNRKESNVHSDLTFLKDIGLLELKESKDHVKKIPVVDYDALHITVPLTT